MSCGKRWPGGCPSNPTNPCGPGAGLGAGQDASEGMWGWEGRLVPPFSGPALQTPSTLGVLSPLSPQPSLGLTSSSPSVLQEFFLQRNLPVLQPLALPPGLSVRQALERVLRLPAVASKRYLTNKVLPAPLLCPLSPLPPSLCSPTPGLPLLGTVVGVHQAQGRSGRGRTTTLMAWSLLPTL